MFLLSTPHREQNTQWIIDNLQSSSSYLKNPLSVDSGRCNEVVKNMTSSDHNIQYLQSLSRSPQNSQVVHSDQVDTGYFMYRHEEAPTILITTHLTVTTFSGQMIHFLFELVLKNWLSCNPTANKMNSKIVLQHLAPTSIHLSIYCLTLRHQWMLIRSENNIL